MLKKNETNQMPELVNDHVAEKRANPRFNELFELERLKAKIGNLMIDYRIKRNLTQGQLAKRIKNKQQEISRFEHGNASLDTLFATLLKLGLLLDVETKNLNNEQEQCDGVKEEFSAHIKYTQWAERIAVGSSKADSKKITFKPMVAK